MAETNELTTGIGNEEAVVLKPAIVEIVSVKIEEVGQNKSKKLICDSKHPDAPDPIKISAVKWETKGKLEISGLWYNVDSKKLIKKGSALATFLLQNGASNIMELVGRKVQTIPDDKGYLVFRAY